MNPKATPPTNHSSYVTPIFRYKCKDETHSCHKYYEVPFCLSLKINISAKIMSLKINPHQYDNALSYSHTRYFGDLPLQTYILAFIVLLLHFKHYTRENKSLYFPLQKHFQSLTLQLY